MKALAIRLKHLAFTGANVASSRVNFEDGLNLIYGASNTGKSFVLSALDFMLGAPELPFIPELKGYETVWLGVSMPGKGEFTFSRSINGGGFEAYEGLVYTKSNSAFLQKLGATQKAKNSLSQFLLEYVGLSGKKLAKNTYGEKENLSFRDVIKLSLVDEGSIQSKVSPVESGRETSRTKERRLFNLVLTGSDDSEIVQLTDDKTFQTSKAARIEVVTEMLLEVEAELQKGFPNSEDLPSQNNQLAAKLGEIQAEFNVLQNSVSELLAEKRRLSTQITDKGQRIDEIQVHLNRFIQLDEVYKSDIDRLSALEEAGFLLSLEERACGLCGSPVESHTIHDMDIRKITTAAFAEIQKIEQQRKELKNTTQSLIIELDQLEIEVPILGRRLKIVEAKIESYAPAVAQSNDSINRIIAVRDNVQKGLALLNQRKDLVARIEEYKQVKKPSESGKPNLSISSVTAYEFCSILSEILEHWGFPGKHNVSFDYKTYDVFIDGKLRTNNGKGVRAITHAAFKIAILVYCHKHNLPHPGFIVLDSPLLTYRDPIRNPKQGQLDDDEKVLAKTNLKENFFEYLSLLEGIAQFIVLENVDPPVGINDIAHVETFYGETGAGRLGLF